MLFSFEGTNLQDPVIIEKWSHLVPSRTQKLSTLSASIAICIDSESSTLPVRELSKESFSFCLKTASLLLNGGGYCKLYVKYLTFFGQNYCIRILLLVKICISDINTAHA